MRLPSFAIILAICAVLCVCTAGANTEPLQTFGHPAFEAINEALLSGRITEGEAHLNRVNLIFNPDKVDPEFRLEGPPIKSGTTILLDAYARSEFFTDAIREEIDRTRVRPYNLPETMVTDHFIVHYTYSGGDMIPNDIYAEFVAEACEVSYDRYHVEQGWQIPPGDGSIGGGTDMIDVYIRNLGTGILGLANPEYQVPGGTPCDWVGFFNVDNSLYRDLYYVTTAHEYMHIVQFGYCATQVNSWFMENCAMMGEEWAYDYINDYIPYLGQWFSYPYKMIHYFNGQYEYGGIVFPMYLDQVFGWAMVRDIWARIKINGEPWSSFDDVYPNYGTQMEDEYVTMIRWCHYTNWRDDHGHYEEAGTWTAMLTPDRMYTSYPQTNQHPSSTKLPQACGTSLMRFRPQNGSTDNILEISFSGTHRTHAVEFIYVESDNVTTTEYFMELTDNEGYIEIPNFDQAADVYMFSSMNRWGGGGQDYTFSASTRLESQDAELNLGDTVQIHPSYPNPFARKTNIAFSLPSTSDVQIRIIDASGRLVRDLYSNPSQYAGDFEVSWNGRDNAGTDVGNGVYFANININGEKSVRELTVIR